MSWLLGVFEKIGQNVLTLLEYVGGLAELFVESMVVFFKGRWRMRLALQQMGFLGVDSLVIVLLTTTFAGMVIAYQLASMAATYGVSGMVGGGAALAMARELGPMLTAVVLAGRAGSAITAEIGSMKVTEQLDALKCMAVSPVEYLVGPRMVAMILMVPLLTLWADLFGLLGGSYVSLEVAGISYNVFWDSVTRIATMDDFIKGMIKAAIFGGEVALIACYEGLRTGKGAAGVGQATTKSVVAAMIVVFITNFLLTAIMFPGGGL